jgi:hypothetical protein
MADLKMDLQLIILVYPRLQLHLLSLGLHFLRQRRAQRCRLASTGLQLTTKMRQLIL